jgi:hypothetical protein
MYDLDRIRITPETKVYIHGERRSDGDFFNYSGLEYNEFHNRLKKALESTGYAKKQDYSPGEPQIVAIRDGAIRLSVKVENETLDSIVYGTFPKNI